MAQAPETFAHEVSERIRSFAIGYPDVEEGTSCVNRAFKVAGKNFVFLGEKADTCTLRLKLGPSVDEVAAHSTEDDRYEVGMGGWTKITFDAAEAPPDDDLQTWVDESFRLLAPKKTLAKLE